MNTWKNLLIRFVFLLAIACSPLFAGNARADEIDALLAALSDGGPEARVSAVEGLAKIRDGRATGALLALIGDTGEDWRIQIRAIKLLSPERVPRLRDLMAQILEDPFFTNDCPALKWNAAVALGNFNGDKRAGDTLMYALRDRDLYVREAAIRSLGLIGDKRAVPFLIPALGDKSFAIRLSAITALGSIRTPEALSHLRRIAQSDSDEMLRGEALSALEQGPAAR